MKTLFFEILAAQNKGKLALMHIFSGLVLGPGFNDPEYPAWFSVSLEVDINSAVWSSTYC
jgi:hypothetical protein